MEGGALAALPPENPLFVDALVLPEAAGLRVETIRSFSPFMPESPPYSGGEDVARGFAGSGGKSGLAAAGTARSDRGKLFLQRHGERFRHAGSERARAASCGLR